PRPASSSRHHPSLLSRCGDHRALHSFPTRRSSDLAVDLPRQPAHRVEDARRSGASSYPYEVGGCGDDTDAGPRRAVRRRPQPERSEEHTSELQSRENLVCRLLLEKKKKQNSTHATT